MVATETSTLVGGNKPQQQATQAAEPRNRLVLGGAAMAIASLCVLGASYYYGHRVHEVLKVGESGAEIAARDAFVHEWEERTQKLFDSGKQTCESCAVVIPSEVLKGGGKGAAIDSHDCVIRFNGHKPEDAPFEDWGLKDNFRVLNAAQTVSQANDKCFDTKHPGCRRIVVTFVRGENPPLKGFLSDHERAELQANIAKTYWPGEENAHQTLYEFADETRVLRPALGSSAYLSVYYFRHPQICGRMTIFGVPASDKDDTTGYIDPHGPPAEAHVYTVEHDLYRRFTNPAQPKPGWENVTLDGLHVK